MATVPAQEGLTATEFWGQERYFDIMVVLGIAYATHGEVAVDSKQFVCSHKRRN